MDKKMFSSIIKNFLYGCRKICLSAALISSACFFASCGTTSNLSKVYVTNTNRVSLLPTQSITSEIEEYQLFEGGFGDKSFTATLYVQANPKGIDVLFLNDFGIEMGSISYDGKTATLESELFPKKLKPEYILLDLQNAYADADALKKHYGASRLKFEESKSGDGTTVRTISRRKKLIETVTASASQTIIKNHLRGYEYRLTSAE